MARQSWYLYSVSGPVRSRPPFRRRTLVSTARGRGRNPGCLRSSSPRQRTPSLPLLRPRPEPNRPPRYLFHFVQTRYRLLAEVWSCQWSQPATCHSTQVHRIFCPLPVEASPIRGVRQSPLQTGPAVLGPSAFPASQGDRRSERWHHESSPFAIADWSTTIILPPPQRRASAPGPSPPRTTPRAHRAVLPIGRHATPASIGLSRHMAKVDHTIGRHVVVGL